MLMKMLKLNALLFYVLYLAQAQSQISPKSYYLSRGSLTSTNGSTTAQECSGRIDNQCTNPTYSVLFDGVIPTLIGLDGNTWASQLFTMQVNSPTILHFTLQRSPDRIEVVLFNCPAWRIAVQTIRLLNTETPNVIQWVSSEIQVRTSCESLVRVCISTTNTESRQFAVYFTHSDTSSWLHLAEIMFLSGPLSPCHSGIIPITTTTQMNSDETPTTNFTSRVSPSHTPTTAFIADTTSQTEQSLRRSTSNTPTSTSTSHVEQSHTPTTPTNPGTVPCPSCPSCFTSTVLFSAITAIITAVLATAICALAVGCYHHRKDNHKPSVSIGWPQLIPETSLSQFGMKNLTKIATLSQDDKEEYESQSNEMAEAKEKELSNIEGPKEKVQKNAQPWEVPQYPAEPRLEPDKEKIIPPVSEVRQNEGDEREQPIGKMVEPVQWKEKPVAMKPPIQWMREPAQGRGDSELAREEVIVEYDIPVVQRRKTSAKESPQRLVEVKLDEYDVPVARNRETVQEKEIMREKETARRKEGGEDRERKDERGKELRGREDTRKRYALPVMPKKSPAQGDRKLLTSARIQNEPGQMAAKQRSEAISNSGVNPLASVRRREQTGSESGIEQERYVTLRMEQESQGGYAIPVIRRNVQGEVQSEEGRYKELITSQQESHAYEVTRRSAGSMGKKRQNLNHVWPMT